RHELRTAGSSCDLLQWAPRRGAHGAYTQAGSLTTTPCVRRLARTKQRHGGVLAARYAMVECFRALRFAAGELCDRHGAAAPLGAQAPGRRGATMDLPRTAP